MVVRQEINTYRTRLKDKLKEGNDLMFHYRRISERDLINFHYFNQYRQSKAPVKAIMQQIATVSFNNCFVELTSFILCLSITSLNTDSWAY